MKIKAYNLITQETRTFNKQKDAADFVGVIKTTLIYRMMRKIPTDGWIFEKVPYTDAEVAKLEKQLARKRELRGVGFIQDSIKDANREKYRIIKYEKNRANACITLCPYYESPKPRIGSTRCQSCAYFHGIDRKLQEVACSRNIENAHRRGSYYKL